VRQVASAQEAFDVLTGELFDLILMDVQLPGLDGLEATKRLKANPATRDIPVVAVTSYAMKGDRETALAAGCCAYITKPIDKTTFVQQVATHLPPMAGSAREG
jgi:CheY-like chemotaxis protein